MCDYFVMGEKVPDCKRKSKFGRIYGRIEILFLVAEVGATFPGLVRGKQSAWLSAEHIKPTLLRRCIKIENRKRNQTLSIRLTDSEKSAINKKSKKAKMTLTEYILKSSLQSEIKVIDLQPLLVELKRIGNNLNQITRKINSGAFNSYNFSEMIAMQRKIYDAIIKLSEDK